MLSEAKARAVAVALTCLGGFASAELVPVSRLSTYSGKGFYSSSWNPPPVYYSWDVTDSCTTFIDWQPKSASYGSFWYVSSALANYARFISSASASGYLGHMYSFEDDQKVGFQYVFDVTYPIRVNIFGFGDVRMTSSTGFVLTGITIPSGGADYVLQPARYTLKDMFTDGHGTAHFELRVQSCLGDMNADAVVDDVDFVEFARTYDVYSCADAEMPPACPGDLNADLRVDDADFVIFVTSYSEMFCD